MERRREGGISCYKLGVVQFKFGHEVGQPTQTRVALHHTEEGRVVPPPLRLTACRRSCLVALDLPPNPRASLTDWSPVAGSVGLTPGPAGRHRLLAMFLVYHIGRSGPGESTLAFYTFPAHWPGRPSLPQQAHFTLRLVCRLLPAGTAVAPPTAHWPRAMPLRSHAAPASGALARGVRGRPLGTLARDRGPIGPWNLVRPSFSLLHQKAWARVPLVSPRRRTGPGQPELRSFASR